MTEMEPTDKGAKVMNRAPAELRGIKLTATYLTATALTVPAYLLFPIVTVQLGQRRGHFLTKEAAHLPIANQR